MLHFREFQNQTGPIPESVLTMINEMKDNANTDELHKLENHDDYKKMMTSYDEYTNETLN